MKKIIGLVGEIGSGKGTFVEVLKSVLPHTTIDVVKFSRVLSDILDTLCLDQTRDNLQRLALMLKNTFGDDVYSEAVRQRILKNDAEIVIVDGIRFPSDISMVRNLPNSYLVYLTADQEVRFNRIIKRNEKIGEGELTFQNFRAQEAAPNESYITEIGATADFAIKNNGGMVDFTRFVQECVAALKLG